MFAPDHVTVWIDELSRRYYCTLRLSDLLLLDVNRIESKEGHSSREKKIAFSSLQLGYKLKCARNTQHNMS